MPLKRRIASLVVIGLCLSMWVAVVKAEPGDHRGFTAELRNCTELIGFGPVPLATAAALVPSGYALVSIVPGTAGLVVRASSCTQFAVDGSAAKPVFVSQIGIATVPPDGTGNINNYQLLYLTNDDTLADALQSAGVLAQVDREFAYEFTPGANNQPGEVYVAVSPPGLRAYFETGGASDPPPNSGAPVVANGWFNGSKGVVKISTSIPSIAYGAATLALHASKVSLPGSLIGGNTDANFAFFNARGLFSAGHLDVAVK
jgi:hypothetical protein